MRFGLEFLAHFRRPKSPVAAPFDGVVLGHDGDDIPVGITPPVAGRADHLLVTAKTGAGKSVLLARLIAEEQNSAEACGADRVAHIVVSPNRDLALRTLEALALVPDALERTTIIDPFDPEHLPALNVAQLEHDDVDGFASHIAAVIGGVSTSRGTIDRGIGARQQDVLESAIAGALGVAHPRRSVLLALDALNEPRGLAQLGSLTSAERARSVLPSLAANADLRGSCASRLRAALAPTRAVEAMFSAADCIDANAMCAPGSITIVDLGGAHRERDVAYLANIILAVILDGVMARPAGASSPVRLVIDELPVVLPAISATGPGLLMRGRSKGVSIVALTQGLEPITQTSKILLEAFMSNADQIVGHVSATDAARFSGLLRARPGIAEDLAKVKASFQSSVTSLTPRHFVFIENGIARKFESVEVDLVSWARARTARQGAIADAVARTPPVDERPRLRLKDALRGEGRREANPDTRATEKPSGSTASVDEGRTSGGMQKRGVLPPRPTNPESPWD